MSTGAARAWIAAAFLLGCLVSACSDPVRERFERAEQAFLDNAMDAALAGYRSIPVDFPQSRYAPAALLRQGDLYGSYYRNAEAALESYTSLLFNYPGSPEVPFALKGRAGIRLFHLFDYASAVGDLERIRTQYPAFERMDAVLLLLAKAYGGVPDPARQVQVLSDLIAQHPDSPRVMEAMWTSAYILLAQERYAEADGKFRAILSRVSGRREAARARWGMAQAMEGTGDFEGALAQYEAIRDDWEDPDFIARKVERLQTRLEEK